MAKRPARPAGTPWLVAFLTVRDAEAALEFYQRAFGFEKKMVIPGPDGRASHVEVMWHDALIMFGPESRCVTKSPATSGTASPMGLYLYCDNVDAQYARATAAGAQTIQAPQDMFWGDRMCRVKDPDGFEWSFGTNVADFDPSKVPH